MNPRRSLVPESESIEDTVRQKAAFVELLKEVAAATNEASASDHAYQTALDRVCALTGWPVGHVYVLAEDSAGEVAPTQLWHLEEPERFNTFRTATEATRAGHGGAFLSRILATGKAAWLRDVSLAPDFRRAKPAAQCGIKTAFAFPVLVGTEVVAILEFFSTQATEPTPVFLDVMGHIGTQLGRVVERERAQKALFLAEARQRAILESALDAVITIDHEGRIVDFNGSAERIFGYRRSDAIGKSLAEAIIPASLREGYYRRMNRYFATGNGSSLGRRVEVTLMRSDGSEFPVELSVTRVPCDGPPLFTGFVRDITARKIAEQALRRAEERLLHVVANAPVALFALDRTGKVTFSEGRALEALGWKQGKMVGQSIYEIYRDFPRITENFERVLAGDEFVSVMEVGDSAFETWYKPIRDERGETQGVVGVATDVTERVRLENQLRQMQRMDAIGRLAGGLAHDFNNLLTVILSHGRLLQHRLTDQEPLQRHVEAIQHTAQRAALLIQQLLAFSRKQVFQTKVLNLNILLADMEMMLQRLIGEAIELVIVPDPALGSVKADPSQLEQIALNLAVNARDAMPHGGRLTIETANVELDEEFARVHAGARPGRYVVLRVRDTGIGMDAETSAHIFEPFYTTKEPGEGTGLGLATVYGIVKQNSGYINVQSTPAHGATFTVYLPRTKAAAETSERERAAIPLVAGRETVLLVEDEEDLRRVAREILEISGYTVLSGRNGTEALQICEQHPGSIDLLLTDVVMPKMSGWELARRLALAHPDVRVLYMSGYTEDAALRHVVTKAGAAFLPKPFMPEDLARMVREVLDAPIAEGPERARAVGMPSIS